MSSSPQVIHNICHRRVASIVVAFDKIFFSAAHFLQDTRTTSFQNQDKSVIANQLLPSTASSTHLEGLPPLICHPTASPQETWGSFAALLPLHFDGDPANTGSEVT